MVFLASGPVWDTDVKATPLYYQQYRALAQKRLKEMRAQGQTKLSVMLWYVQEGEKCAFRAHYICPQKGKMPASVVSNLRLFLQDASAAHFDTLVFRLGAQGLADPFSENYDTRRIEDTWKLFEESYTQVEYAAIGTNIKVIYDMGVEMMGHPFTLRPAVQLFLKTMWSRYIAKYPLDKTIGFSWNHAHGPEPVDSSLNIFKNSGKWPAMIGMDIYESPEIVLDYLADGLARAGKAGFPVSVIETFYNSDQFGNAYRVKKSRINFQFILQWPSPEKGETLVSGVETPLVDAYIDKTLFPVPKTPTRVTGGAQRPVMVPAPPPAPGRPSGGNGQVRTRASSL